ncbi:sugar nucleotide-binding protein [Candidatus Nanopelagicales bacterium]|nr:sugar nucleotide-binding protein [Candidatus Nanopelagicales bacterium]
MKWLTRGRFAVIGASGQIGSALLPELERRFPENGRVVGTSRQGDQTSLFKFDLRDPESVIPMEALGPDDTVVLLAAVSNPNLAFEDPNFARSTNVGGADRVVRTCRDSGARLLFFSSVEVFDGRNGPFHEGRRANPLNVYGQTKAEIEALIRSSLHPGQFCIVRTPWNVGFTPGPRCVVKLTYGSLLAGGARMAVDNLISIIDIRDTVDGVTSILSHPDGFVAPVIHLAAGQTFARDDLAELVRTESRLGDRMTFDRVTFDQLPLREPRGKDVRLDAALSREVFGLRYRSATETVLVKVQLLDEWLEAGIDLTFE